MQPTPWTPDLVGRLRELVLEMAAANGKIRIRDIADVLHVSKNAVVGKLARLRRQHTDIPDLRIPALMGRPQIKGRRKVRHVRRIPPVPPMPEPPQQLEPPAIGCVTLLELRPCQCRWPYGEQAPYTFCGARTERGAPYCEPHATIARGYPRRP